MKKAAVYLLVFLALSSCKKKEEPPPANTEPQNAPFIVIGQTSDMHVRPVFVTRADVDQDGTDDVELKMEMLKAGPGPNVKPKVTLMSLHPGLLIRTYGSRDTLYRSTTVSFSRVKINATDSQVYKTTNITETCVRPVNATTVSASESVHPFRCVALQAIMPADKFTTGNFVVWDLYSDYYDAPVGTYPDTAKVTTYSYNKYCNQVLSDGDTYIAIKLLLPDSRYKLGWIRIRKTVQEFTIVETAVSN